MNVCKNCALWDKNTGVCGVNVTFHGELLELTTKPDDECFWLKNGIDVKQLRMFEKNNKVFLETTN